MTSIYNDKIIKVISTITNYIINFMEGQNNNHQHSDQSCQWHGHRYFFLRWILGIIILIIVFSFGFKLGEFSSFINGGENYGYGSMMENGYWNPAAHCNMMWPVYQNQNYSRTPNYFYGPGMMEGYYLQSTTTPR